ncbi:MAG: hypothetical protein H0X63_00100 [Flavobacteriales bacterium]|nr:hypothetical protein [Flavobacteriales bacterium]
MKDYKSYKPSEEFYKTHPSLYLAICWAIRFKELVIDPESDVIRDGKIGPAYTNYDLQEKRYFADKVLVCSKNAKLVYNNSLEINKARNNEKVNRREFGGKLTTEQRWAFSYDYFELIDKLCDKLFLIKVDYEKNI